MKEKWILHPTTLEGSNVELIPLEKEHFEELYAAADKDDEQDAARQKIETLIREKETSRKS